MESVDIISLLEGPNYYWGQISPFDRTHVEQIETEQSKVWNQLKTMSI